MNRINSELPASAQPLTADRLKGKQSVRATFRLAPHCIELLSCAANHLGIKQKSLFDQLVEDKAILNAIARDAKLREPRRRGRQQKTYVLSRQSLQSLDTVAKKNNVSRDALVEYSIKRLKPVVDAEREKHQKRRQLLDQVADLLSLVKGLQGKSLSMLGGADVFSQKVASMAEHFEKRAAELGDMVLRAEEEKRKKQNRSIVLP